MSAQAKRLLVGMKEAQQLLGGMGYGKLRALCVAGKVPHVRFGRDYKFNPELLEEWVKQESQQRMA